MRYLMFADTKRGEFYTTVDAKDDDQACTKMRTWLNNQKVPSSEIYSMAGIWEKDPKFHTATSIRDLEEEY